MISKDLINATLKELESVSGFITEVERYGIHDGPGIRSVVFLKGCPLRCAWCCNPETQQRYVEMAFFHDKCINCGKCVLDCKYNAITVVDEEMVVDRSICENNCYGKTEKFPCTLRCYSGARKAIGESRTVLEVYKEVIRDLPFYERTNGGVTISGGEALFQPNFVYSLLRYCKENWINTAIETCGSGSTEDYTLIAPFLDVVFVDLKNLDVEKHKSWTTHDNTLILKNIKHLSELALIHGFKMYVRVPVIPGFNDSKQHILDIGNLIKDECKGVTGIELLAYHKLGRGKYKSIGREYALKDLDPPSEEYMEGLNNLLLQLGLSVYQF